jgi:hypothetical protein
MRNIWIDIGIIFLLNVSFLEQITSIYQYCISNYRLLYSVLYMTSGSTFHDPGPKFGPYFWPDMQMDLK